MRKWKICPARAGAAARFAIIPTAVWTILSANRPLWFWGALNARDKGVRGSGGRILGHSLGQFLKGYVLKRGFLDGTRGLIIAFMEAYAAFLKYGKLWEMQNAESIAAAAPRPPLGASPVSDSNRS